MKTFDALKYVTIQILFCTIQRCIQFLNIFLLFGLFFFSLVWTYSLVASLLLLIVVYASAGIFKLCNHVAKKNNQKQQTKTHNGRKKHSANFVHSRFSSVFIVEIRKVCFLHIFHLWFYRIVDVYFPYGNI